MTTSYFFSMNSEVSQSELDLVSGGETPFGCKVTAVNDVSLGGLGTIHLDTVQCGGKSGTAVSWSPPWHA